MAQTGVAMAGARGLDGKAEAPYVADKYDLQLMIVADYRRFCATTIQRYWRGHSVRSKLRRQREAERAAQVAAADDARQRADVGRLHEAARRIQRAWQAFSSKRIYRYYRDLIRFREQGDPRALLKCINPQEAALADAAAGVHVRFRLGGSTFPPLVFYKIFTHRPITDICSFCPRDYAAEAGPGASGAAPAAAAHQQPLTSTSGAQALREQQRRGPGSRAEAAGGDFQLADELRPYTKPDGSTGHRSTVGWYRRNENNGWRPLSDRLLQGRAQGEDAAARKLPAFHHSPLVRRQARAARLKQRRREWLAKVYGLGGAAGAATAAGDGGGGAGGDGSSSSGRRHAGEGVGASAAAQQVPAAAEAAGGAGGGEQLLLRWAQLLDFEAYVCDWTEAACTLGSEALVPQAEAQLAAALLQSEAAAARAARSGGDGQGGRAYAWAPGSWQAGAVGAGAQQLPRTRCGIKMAAG